MKRCIAHLIALAAVWAIGWTVLGLAKPAEKLDLFQDYCRSRLYELRDELVASIDTGAATKQWVITFTEYVDQCLEKR